MSKFTIKQIFIDNWDNFTLNCSDTTVRPIVFDEVNKIINCGNPDFGYALYVCEHCGNIVFTMSNKLWLYFQNIDTF